MLGKRLILMTLIIAVGVVAVVSIVRVAVNPKFNYYQDNQDLSEVIDKLN